MAVIDLALIVHRAIDVRWSAGRLSQDTPTFYIQIKYKQSNASKVWKTKEVRDIAPEWGDEFTLASSHEDSVLQFSLKRRSRLRDQVLCKAECKASDLSPFPKALKLFKEGNTNPLASVIVSARPINLEEAAGRLHQEARAIRDQPDDGSKYVGKAKSIVERLQSLSGVVGAIDQLTQLNPWVDFAWRICSSLYKIVEKQYSTDQKVLELVGTIDRTLDFVEDVKKIEEDASYFGFILNDLLHQVAECAIFVCECLQPSFIKRLVKQLVADPTAKIEEFTKAFSQFRDNIDSKVHLRIALVSAKMSQDVSQLLQSDALNVLRPTMMNVGDRPLCLPGTRQEDLQAITDWVVNVNGDQPNVLWLHGLAGTGKSTIARTVSAYLEKLGRAGAFLFFERAKDGRDTIVQTLAVQLANSDSLLRSVICQAIERDRNIANKDLETQFSTLIVEPLRDAARSLHGPIVVVLDALDECGDMDERESLLCLISTQFTQLPPYFRFLITSRRETDIDTILFEQPGIVSRSLEKAGEDVQTYLVSRMAYVHKVHCIKSMTWPEENDLEKLTEMSEGLFIWASTLSKFLLHTPDPEAQLGRILSRESREHSRGLNGLYRTVLEAWKGWDEAFVEIFRRVMGAILFCHEPFNDTSIKQFLGLSSQELGSIFTSFRCLLDYDLGKPIRPLHASFRDYLTDENRSGGNPWCLVDYDAHEDISVCCFRVMSEQLRFNICNFETSHLLNKDYSDLEERVERNISPALRYASSQWMNHLSETRHPDEALLQALINFSKERVFFWFEVIGLIATELSDHFHKIRDILKKHEYPDYIVELWAGDIKDFFFQYGDIMRTNTPHLYVSGSMYLQETQSLSMLYSSLLHNASVLARDDTEIADGTAIDKANQKGHSSSNTSIAFSPDGTKFLVSSDNGVVHVRNTFDCSLIPEYWPLEYPSGVVCATFSVDSALIYVVLENGVIYSSTGNVLYQLDGDVGDCREIPVYLSSGEEHIAVVYENKAVVLSKDSGLIRGPYTTSLENAEDYYAAASISSDGVLAFVLHSRRDEIRFLDLETGRVPPSIITTHNIHGMAYALDGNHIILWAFPNFQIWDVGSRCLLRTITNDISYTSLRHMLCISPDSHLAVTIFSDSDNTRMKPWIWNLQDQDLVKIVDFEGFTCKIAFSPDSQRLLACDDSRIAMWDLSALLKRDDNTAQDHNITTGKSRTAGSRSWPGLPSGWSVDGSWILGPNHERMLYIPHYLWEERVPPDCTHFISRIRPWKLDFGIDGFIHGTDWVKCYRPSSNMETTVTA
ncbi:hypothetical protein QCA50_013523 [Cerrena zonata]|uniref:NACHT domain-containing protein n=1 Tax=Cerrena zonata TaxID=2478898 RepID=A0AAW0FQX3_9APHY